MLWRILRFRARPDQILYVLCASSFAHDLDWKRSTNVIGRNDLSHRLPPTSKPNHWSILTRQFLVLQVSRLNWLRASLVLVSWFKVKHPDASLIVLLRHQRIDKSYLLRLPCTKPIVMFKTSPIVSIADLKTHLHVIHATLQHLFSHPTTRISETSLSYKDVNQYGSDLAICIWEAVSLLAAPRNSSSQISLPDVFKSWVDSLRIPFWVIDVRLAKLPLNHVWNLPAASQMHLRSLGQAWEIAFYAPSALRPGSSWDFRLHPKSLASIHFFIFIPLSCDFLWFLVLSHALKTNWANLTTSL